MDTNLIENLQQKAGLTEEQSLKAVAVMKNYMEKEGIDIDWEKFFKGHYEKYMNKSKDLMNQLKGKVDSLSDEFNDKIDDLSTQAKHKARDLTKKVYDKLNDEEQQS